MDTIILSCGAEDASGDIYQDDTPTHPQILPIPPSDQENTLLLPSSLTSRKRKRSNGCGTILHYAAMVSQNRMWRAGAMCTRRDIVPLEEGYFSEDARKLLSFGWRTCGCTRSGIGCAVCGNPLGSLFVPCPIHQESKSGLSYYYILPSAVSPPLPPNTFPAHPRLRPRAAPPPPPRVVIPLPRHRRRHPTSPPPRPILEVEFTPTPSPEILHVDLPSTDDAYIEVGADFGNNEEHDQDSEDERTAAPIHTADTNASEAG